MSAGGTRIDVLHGPGAAEVLQPLFDEFGRWVAGRLASDYGLVVDDEALQRHHRAFQAEFPKLLAPPGCLLVARVDGVTVGSGALKPVGPTTGELKRIFVTPPARGRGVARAVVTELLRRARGQGYTSVRLESLAFMTEAHGLYRSVGFTDGQIFDGAEATITSALVAHSRFMKVVF